MPDQNYHLNLAAIVHRVLTSHRGWRVDHLMDEMGIKSRTYRKYRKVLKEQFGPFQNSNGGMLQEVKDGDSRYLRLVEVPETHPKEKLFAARVAALHFAKLMMGFVQGTDVAEVMDDLMRDFETGLKDRQFTLSHMLRNVDRIFFQLPDAPKDYSTQGGTVSSLLRSLIFTYRIRIEYDSANFEGLELELEPYTIAVHRSALYLIAKAAGHDDVRIYAVDRIRNVEVLSQKFEYPKDFEYDPVDYTEGSFGIFRSDSTHKIEFHLLFSDKKWLKLHIQERSWHPSQSIEELPDGRLSLKFTVNTDVEVWPWIRSFGDDVELISPAAAE